MLSKVILNAKENHSKILIKDNLMDLIAFIERLKVFCLLRDLQKLLWIYDKEHVVSMVIILRIFFKTNVFQTLDKVNI